MATGDVHVTYRIDEEKWAVEVEGNTRASSLHDTKVPAEQVARAKAQENQSELVLHGKDGEIQERNSYKRDARTSRSRLGTNVSKRLWLPIAVASAALLAVFLVRRAFR